MTILPLEKILQSDTIHDLLQSYKSAGADVSDTLDSKTIKILKADWKEHKKQEKRSRENETILDTPHVDTVSVAGITYTIVGFGHLKRLQSHTYKQHMLRYALDAKNILTEKKVAEYSFHSVDSSISYTEMNDASAHYLFDAPINGFLLASIQLPSLIKLQFKKKPPTRSHSAILMHGEFLYSLPPIVHLEKWNEGSSHVESPSSDVFARCISRSAYMAEFALNYKLGEDKTIFVGDAHRTEIKYFLEHGVKRNRPARLAKKDALECQQNPFKYNSRKYSYNELEDYSFWGGLIATAMLEVNLIIDFVQYISKLL